MKNDLDWLGLGGRVCVVTGAGRGIGASIASSFAKAGALVALLDRDLSSCEATQKAIAETGGRAIALEVDVADPASIAAAADECLRVLGPADVLVNNAGTVAAAALAGVELDKWNAVMAVNVTGPLICSQIFGGQMLKRGAGSMVHIASLSAHFPQPYSGAYSVSKAGISMMSQLLALEWGEHGVRSNAVSPGLIRTPLSEGMFKDPEIVQMRKNVVPLRRIGAPEDIADVVLFLASDRARYVTGQNLIVDGGVSSALMGLIPRPGFERTAPQAGSAS